jgi:quercetin dioxygenase-like cupin family protein
MSRLQNAFRCALIFVLGLGPARGFSAQDPVATNPGKYRVVFENDQVRLLEFQDEPGDVTVMHYHPARLVYSLAPWKKKFHFPDGRTVVMEGKAGDATWAEAGSHAGENIGSSETHILIFELKERPTK